MKKKLIQTWDLVRLNQLTEVLDQITLMLSSPYALFLEGDLGSGKTTLVRFILGEEVSSPTYSLIHEYGNSVHADLYRLESVEEIEYLELPYYLENKQRFFIEWGETFFDYLQEFIPDYWSQYLLEISSVKDSQTNEFRKYSLYSIG